MDDDLTWDLLTKETVQRFGGTDDDWPRWRDVQWTAQRFWSTAVRSSARPSERQAAFHHLVMTAGNFKRQAPITLPVPQVAPGTGRNRTARFSIDIAGELVTIDRDDPDSWKKLDAGVPGIGVATATTILSAIWPGHHIVADRRDVYAGMGLAYDEARGLGLLEGKPAPVNWKRYEWLLPKVKAKAADIDLEPVQVERALYVLDQKAALEPEDHQNWGGKPDPDNWGKYRLKLRDVIRAAS